MKTRNTALAAIILLLSGLYTSDCHRQYASTASAQQASKPGASVTVAIAITSVKPEFGSSATTTYDTSTQTEPVVTIYWDGNKFTGKSETGRMLMAFTPDLAFDKQTTAAFRIKKKVTIKSGNGTSTLASSLTTTVKRGVPAKM